MKINHIRPSMPKHSLVIDGHKTSVTMQDAFWVAFKEIADRRNIALYELAAEIEDGRDPDDDRGMSGLSSAIRVYILEDAIKRARESEQRAAESEANAAALRIAVKALVEDRDRAAKIREGIAPISAVIARGRANA
jgi:predicted DNA-binding ribbon-helix-helix protein